MYNNIARTILTLVRNQVYDFTMLKVLMNIFNEDHNGQYFS